MCLVAYGAVKKKYTYSFVKNKVISLANLTWDKHWFDVGFGQTVTWELSSSCKLVFKLSNPLKIQQLGL